jgi:hypothetical protein
MSKFRLGVPVLPGTTGGKGDTKKNVQHSTFNVQMLVVPVLFGAAGGI